MDIQFKDVSYTYEAGTPIQHTALKNIDLTFLPQKFTAIIGKTGSGKSTLVQHLNALLKPTQGVVRIGNRSITPTTGNKQLKALRKKVGTVFQFPEAQLFGQTIKEDVMFGPKNYGVKPGNALLIAERALEMVGLDASFLEQSPFDLSGGQQRRVAIAGVLALEPEILVLDEPTAGLDPRGQAEIMDMFYRLNTEQNTTIIMVTHQMEQVAEYADDVIVMKEGAVAKQGTPREIFSDTKLLVENDLHVPHTVAFQIALEEKYGWKLPELALTTDDLALSLKQYIRDLKEDRYEE